MNAYTNARLVQGSRLSDTATVRRKVEQDIAFLTSRIATLEAHHRPNKPVIDTYKTMLTSRKAVLNWLCYGQFEGGQPSANLDSGAHV